MEFPVTADQVRQTVIDYGITRLPHHPCSLCGAWTAYRFSEDGRQAAYDSNCNCGGWSDLRTVPWEDVAEFINQRDTAVAQTIWDRLMAQATKQPPKPIGVLIEPVGTLNPRIMVTPDEVNAWLRSIADAHGFKDRESVAVQIAWDEMSGEAPGDYHREVRLAVPELIVMVSNIPNSRVPS